MLILFFRQGDSEPLKPNMCFLGGCENKDWKVSGREMGKSKFFCNFLMDLTVSGRAAVSSEAWHGIREIR